MPSKNGIDSVPENPRLDAALGYAERGWAVLPLEWIDNGKCSCAKNPCSGKPGKHPRSGIGAKSATTDPVKIRAWWSKWPRANIGIATGSTSGLLMLGPDGRKGIEDLEALEAIHGRLPRTMQAHSGSGGRHYYFRYPLAGAAITLGANHRGTSIDFRGNGGYAVAPPSVNANGSYSWTDDCEVAEAPAWLTDWLRANVKKPLTAKPQFSATSGEIAILERARKYLAQMGAGVQGNAGSNPTMAAARAMVYGFDLGRTAALELLLSEYNPRCSPPWSEAELLHKIEDADTKPFDKPRGWLLNNQRTEPLVVTPQAETWPDPVPLVTLPEVPPFPTEALPIWMREYVLALAIELQVPTDLPGILVLVAAAAGISRKVVVSPRPGWEKEPTNLYGMVSLPPGEKKSQTLRKALRPIAELECEMQECERPNIERAESEFKVAELRVQHLQQRIAKSDSAEDRAALKVELGRAIEERQAVVVPAIPYLSVDDDTPDKLAQELANQKGRLLVASAEPKALENISLYGDQPNFDVYLKGHAGDDLKVGRISRGRQSVTRPALSCLFTPQPLVLETLGATDALRGRGFLARWFYGLPISNVGYRDVNPPAMNAEVESNYSRWMKTLWRTEYAMDGEDIAPYELKLTSDALVLLHEFLQWIELELRPGGRLYGMAGWGNKLCGLAVRLSGVLHVAGNLNPYAPWTRKPIDSDTVQAAIGLARDYAVGHARAAFALMGEVEKVAHAKKVQKWLKQREDRYAEFSKRDCFNGCRGTFDTVDDLQPALDLLERHFLVRPKEMERKQGAGRNPSQVYSVSPSAFAEEAATHNPHFAQKACGGPLVGNSAESAHSARPPYSLNAQVKPKRTGSAKSTAKATTDSLFGELSHGLPD